MIYPRVAVIGTGLIGGSFALAVKQAGVVGHIIGVARSESTRQAALELAAADEVIADAAEAVAEADLVYIAVPVGAMATIFSQISASLSPGTMVTDVGSTKTEVMAAAHDLLPDYVTFVGGHPLAGSEQAGIRAARADLFEGCKYFLVADEENSGDELSRLIQLIQALGAAPVLTGAPRHDQLMAATSHLPHLMAAVLTNTIGAMVGDEEDSADFVGSGFVDTTRLAAGSPEVWRDIFLTNEENVARTIAAFVRQLQRFGQALRSTDANQLDELLEEARRWREKLGK